MDLRRIVALTAVLAVASGICHGVDARHIYKSIGPDGRVTYSDRPPAAEDEGHTETLLIPSDPASYPPPDGTPQAEPLPGAEGTAIPADPGSAAAAIAPGSDGTAGGADTSGVAPGSGGGIGGASGGGGGGGGSASGGQGSSRGASTGPGGSGGAPSAPASSDGTALRGSPAPARPTPPAAGEPTGGVADRGDTGGEARPSADATPGPGTSSPVADVGGDDTADAAPPAPAPPQTEPAPSPSPPAPLTTPEPPPPSPPSTPLSSPAPPMPPAPSPVDGQSAQCDGTNGIRLAPEDINYLGSFMLPKRAPPMPRIDASHGALAYRPDGDPDGIGDFPGSLIVTGRESERTVVEMTIPTPRMDGTARARFLSGGTPITDATNRNLCGPFPSGERVSGLLVTNGSLYWTCRSFYAVGSSAGAIGKSTLDYVAQRGDMVLGRGGAPAHSNKWAGHMLQIPADWCETYTGGRCLGAGLSGVSGTATSSYGPALFAWREDDPLNSIALMLYSDTARDPHGWNPGYGWWGSEWVKTTAGSAVIIGGRTAGGDRPPETQCCYGERDYCATRIGETQLSQGSKGYHCDPYQPTLRFYDPGQLADVAMGLRSPSTVSSYAEVNLSAMYEAKGNRSLDGITWGMASDGQHLYVTEQHGDFVSDPFARLPVIHVFELPGERCPTG